MKKSLLVVAIMILPQVALGAESSPKQNSVPPKRAVFAQIARAASTVSTLSSDFVEEKHLAMLKDPPISRGRFYYQKPDKLRWELTAPVSFGFVVNGNRARRWRGEETASQRFEISREPILRVFVGQVFAWARADFEWLEQRYQVTVLQDKPAEVKLVPISPMEGNFLDFMVLFFAADGSHLRAMEVYETGGDFMRIRFFNMVLNGPLSKELF